MASSKSALKAVRAALDGEKYEEAINQAKNILASDEQNITACAFEKHSTKYLANSLQAAVLGSRIREAKQAR